MMRESMVKVFFLWSSTVFAFGAFCPNSRAQDRDFPSSAQMVIKEVIIPESPIIGEEVAVELPRYLGDFDKDGLIEVGLAWHSFDYLGGSSTGIMAAVGDWRELRSMISNLGWKVEDQFASINYPRMDQIALVVNNHSYVTDLRGLDLVAHSLWERQPSVALHPPPPSYSFSSLSRSGDVNGDGNDDFFYYSLDGTSAINVGLFDSATDAPLWADRTVLPITHASFPVQDQSKILPDLNGDGFGDFVAAYQLPWGGPTNDFEIFYRAYSGLDGQVLWETTHGSLNGIRSHCFGADVDGDGIRDIFRLGGFGVDFLNETYYDRGLVQAISGLDGSEIWRGESYQIDPNWRSGPNLDRYYQASRIIVTCPDWDLDGVDDLLCGAFLLTPNGELNGMSFGLFSGATGVLVRNFSLPETLFPWAKDPLGINVNSEVAVSVGDLDNDGWPEIGYSFDAPSFDNDGNAATPPRGLAILSLPSLILSKASRSSDTFSYGIHVPSGPGLRYQIIASTSFGYGNGLREGGWETHLAPSTVLDKSLMNPIHGVLTDKGRASGEFTLQAGFLSPGTLVFVRAIISDPNLGGRTYTISNLGWFEID